MQLIHNYERYTLGQIFSLESDYCEVIDINEFNPIEKSFTPSERQSFNCPYNSIVAYK